MRKRAARQAPTAGTPNSLWVWACLLATLLLLSTLALPQLAALLPSLPFLLHLCVTSQLHANRQTPAHPRNIAQESDVSRRLLVRSVELPLPGSHVTLAQTPLRSRGVSSPRTRNTTAGIAERLVGAAPHRDPAEAIIRAAHVVRKERPPTGSPASFGAHFSRSGHSSEFAPIPNDVRAGGGARVLVVLCGLLRYWRFGIEALHQQLFSVNPRIHFDVALLTSERVACTDRDRAWGECPCFSSEFPRGGSKNVTATVQALLPPRSRVTFTLYTLAFHSGGIGERFPVRLARGMSAMADAEGGELLRRYQRVFVIRPDAVLTGPLDVERACQPGQPILRLVSGTILRPLYFHERDWDHAMLACHPSAIEVWLRPWRNASVRCKPGKPLPPLPAAFRGRWDDSSALPPNGSKLGPKGGGQHECGGLLELRRENMNLGTLDDYDVYSRLMVARGHTGRDGVQPNVSHRFGGLRTEGCLPAINYSKIDP
jgi:hypothetical protein